VGSPPLVPKSRADRRSRGRRPAPPSGRRDSNPRPSPWQGDALPAEPRPHAHAKTNVRFRTVADPAPAANSTTPGASVFRGSDQAANLLGVEGHAGNMFRDLAQCPRLAAISVPGLRSRHFVAQQVAPRQPPQPGPSLVVVELGEPGPVGVERHQAAVPLVWHRLGTRQQRLDLVQVIDQVVGDAADGLVRGPGAGQVVDDARDRPAVPCVPGQGQVQALVHAGDDGGSGVLVGHASILVEQ
jgi:hypothetical protein